jgi:hypothetical protein
MSLIASSAGCFSGPDFCLIFAPCGYDDPEILPNVKTPRCLKGADGGQIEASFSKGLLTVTLPKSAEAQKSAKTIAVKAA